MPNPLSVDLPRHHFRATIGRCLSGLGADNLRSPLICLDPSNDVGSAHGTGLAGNFLTVPENDDRWNTLNAKLPSYGLFGVSIELGQSD
jgi:hypothetical protein